LLLSQISFLYIFLPLFMGIYALLKPERRPSLIALANLAFIALYNARGLIVFAISFLAAYFSAIAIYNARNDSAKQGRRKLLLAANVLIQAAVFACFAHTSQLPDSSLKSLAMFGAAVIPLHTVSYLCDVYRGDCEVQTHLPTLAAYTAFFPAAGFGTVMKYKCFKRSFASPKITHQKLAEGIHCYIGGLAEYTIISAELQKVWDGIKSTSAGNLNALPMLLSVLILYVLFCIKVMGVINMGRGVAMMLGFYVRPPFKRKITKLSLTEHMRSFNIQLNSWLKDYVMKPILSCGGKLSGIIGTAAVILCAALWYTFQIDAALVALLMSAVLIFESRMQKKILATPKTVQSDFIEYTLGTSILPLTLGLLIMSGLLSAFLRKATGEWYKTALPAIDLVLLMLCTAFMLA
jgi:D-alanyl-lipoteichoic acid acyltransferase DltB (MBOAT superfamily)